MTLTDAGPLFVLFNRKDPDYARCAALLPHLRAPLVTTWPCFTEAMYLLGRDLGHTAQDQLWQFVVDGLLNIHNSPDPERLRMRTLMRQYRDTPMDIADASLVAAAETLAVSRVFTLDKHFYAYRLADGTALEVVP
jgi:predicted nucleic acid-binding protein